MITVFSLIAGMLLTGMNYLVYRQLIVSFLSKKTGLVCISVITICTVIYICGLRIVELPDFLYKTGAVCLGLSFMLFVITLFYMAGKWLFRQVSLPVNQRKRRFLSLCFKGAIVGAGAGYVSTGIYSGKSLPRISTIPIKIANLQRPLTIAQITDIHLGVFLQKDFLQAIVHLTNEQDPDLVVITGDIIDMPPEAIGDILDPFGQLKTRYGVFCVPGNHEYYYGVNGILARLAQLGITILGNRTKQIAGINIAGVYDLAALQLQRGPFPNLEAALETRDPALPTVLLAHQPKFIEHVTPDHRIDLMISGHTHAGQIVPFSLLVLLDQPYLHGLYHHDSITRIYVSSGAGFWGPPFRCGAPAEIAVLQLTEEPRSASLLRK